METILCDEVVHLPDVERLRVGAFQRLWTKSPEFTLGSHKFQ